jgi:hypothetical protein
VIAVVLPKTSRKYQTQINVVQWIKNIPFIIIVLSVLIYQVQWFQSIQKISFSYDLGNLLSNQTPNSAQSNFNNVLGNATYQGEGLEKMFEALLEIITNNLTDTINITEVEQIVLQNTTLIENIENVIGYIPTFAEQIYLAYLNGTLSWNLLKEFLILLWNSIFRAYIPESWFYPISLYVHNNGSFDITRFKVVGGILWFDSYYLFINQSDSILKAKDNFQINFTIYDLVYSLFYSNFDFLLNETIEVIKKDPFGKLNSFADVLIDLIKTGNPDFRFEIGGLMGFIFMDIKIEVDLSPIINDLIQEV